ncbi:MAG: hypothetical protein JWO95_2759, partial [Verrucomicrobiales bacterium]|nr:hypothetical protein [Verrucomicrobiales bacterium]
MTLREIGGAQQEICLALDPKTGNELRATSYGVANYGEKSTG